MNLHWFRAKLCWLFGHSPVPLQVYVDDDPEPQLTLGIICDHCWKKM